MHTRYTYLDTVGGIMILHMMYIVHAAHFTNIFPQQVEYIMELLTCFLPWFYFKSGMFYKAQGSFKDFFVKRVKTLLIPFAVFSFIGWFFIYFLGSIFFSEESLYNLITNSIATFLWQGAFNGNFALWFLFSLFWVNILYQLFRMMRLNNYIIMFFSFVCAYCIYQFEVSLPTYIGNVCNGLFFYSLGVALKQRQFNDTLFLISILILVASAVFPSYLDFRANRIMAGNNSYLLAELYCLSGIVFFNNVFSRYFPTRISILTHVGENSMKYYVVHYIFLIGILRILTMVFYLSDPVVLFLIIAVAMTILLYFSGIILSKKAFAVLMGGH